MENSGNGGTMSPGIQAPVGNITNISEARSFGVPKAPDTVSTPEKIEEVAKKPSEAEKIDFAKKKEQKVQEADHLIEVAKKDGVDKALEKIAKRKFPKDDLVKEVNDAEISSKSTDEGEVIEDENKIPSPLEYEVRELSAKVESIASNNGEMKKRLENLEEMNKLALMSIYELAQALRKMIEESEEKNKEGLLMIIAMIMAKLMEEMFVPKEKDGVLDGQSKEERAFEKMAS